jgi:SP family general alpha glucoside:H+ symporter-like MFS transporter
MEGYDVVVIGSFYGQRELHTAWCQSLIKLADFVKRFGVPTDTTEIGYAIPPEWQSALSNGSSAGGIIGLLVSIRRCMHVAKLTQSSTDGQQTNMDLKL